MSSVNKVDKIEKIQNKFKEKSMNVRRKPEKKEPITGSKKTQAKISLKDPGPGHYCKENGWPSWPRGLSAKHPT